MDPIPPNDVPATEASSGAAGRASGSLRTASAIPHTLPPPEWVAHEGPRSAASVALERYELDEPVAHRRGPRAELGWLAARLAEASASADVEHERLHAAALARALAARGTEFELATRLARRALVLGEDPGLREELSGWFASLGEPALAAASLRPLALARTGREAAALHLRVAALLARAADAHGANEALLQAARDSPTDPVIFELIGAIGAWAPSALLPERAAQAYLDASERREAFGERPAAFENLIRAHEIAPGYVRAVERLASALRARARGNAADEVWREHARALGAAGRAVHEQRLRDAVKEGDLPRALGAAFDAGLDAELDLKSMLRTLGPSAAETDASAANAAESSAAELGFDELLERAGLHELLVARLEFGTDALSAREAFHARMASARLLAGPLGRSARAAEFWVEALALDPSSTVAIDSLRAYGNTSIEHLALVELLIRYALRENEATPAEREQRLREIVTWAEARWADPGLALWAQSRLALPRETAGAELEALAARLLERARTPADIARLRLALASARRRHGDLPGALRELVPLLDAPESQGAVFSMALLLSAQCGERALRARSLLRMASVLSPSFRAVVCSVAAEELFEAGDVPRARVAAEQACNADPSLARPIAVRARIGSTAGDRWGADAMERAMGVVVPSGTLCAALAQTHDELDEPLLALAWTQRLVALRPGDPEAIRARLDRINRTGDGPRLADALAWLFAQAQPLGGLEEPIVQSLLELLRLDPPRAGALARRALDVLGPRGAELRGAVLTVADASAERGLGIAAIERWLSAGLGGADRAQVLLDLARRRRAAGDADGSARVLLRAVREGAPAAPVIAELDTAPRPKSSDGELALLEARAEASSISSEAAQAGTARAWREVGAAYWDLAADAPHALRAFERAMSLNPERGPECLASDLLAFAGPERGFEALNEMATRRKDPREAAHLLALAATMALNAGRNRLALEVATRALDLDPTRADVLAVAERSAESADLELLDALYQRLAEASLGRFGERAVHYRAARQFERRSVLDRALTHAVRAFESVPSEGVTFVAMVRLAERAEQSAEVARVLERVALDNPSPEARTAWLRRAAAVAGSSEEGRRQRVEVLLRALAIRGDVEVVRALAAALRELVALVPEERESLELRSERAFARLLPKLEGPEGTRIAVECALAALSAFGSARSALAALERAAECDGDMLEFEFLFEHAAALAREPAPASHFVLRVAELALDRFGSTGTALLELAARVARALGDVNQEAKLLVFAATRDPENTELVRRAEARARATRDPELLAAILEAVPPQELAAALLGDARAAEQRRDYDAAIDALRRALELPELAPADRRGAFQRWGEILRQTGRRNELERLLESELSEAGLESYERARIGGELAALIGARGDHERALGILRALLAERPNDETLLSEMAALARHAGDQWAEVEALARLADGTTESRDKLPLLRDVAALLTELGDEAQALLRFREVFALDPADVSAISALERDAERRGDYESLVSLLGRRADLVSSVEEVRRIRLRQATVLEQRLGRPDEARSELEAVLAATGDHLSVLRVLADLNERLGAELRAAPLWLRASAVTQDRTEAADLSRRACEAYLASGDVESARRVLEGMGAWAHSQRLLELCVEVERRRDHPLGLAAALEELATASSALPEQRALWLVEAARASLAGGALEAALAQAQRASELAPDAADPQLFARYLEYLLRGAGEGPTASSAISELRGLRGVLDAEQTELRAFLMAEALDVAVGSGSGFRELEKALAEVGERPLICLGLAERLAEVDPSRSLHFFDLALDADLRRVRSRGELGLRAAEVAFAAGALERTRAYLEIATFDANSRAAAQAFSRRINGPSDAPKPALRSTLGVSPSSVPPKPEAGRYSARPPPLAATEYLVARGRQSTEALAIDLEAKKSLDPGLSTLFSGRYSLVPEDQIEATPPRSEPVQAPRVRSPAPASSPPGTLPRPTDLTPRPHSPYPARVNSPPPGRVGRAGSEPRMPERALEDPLVRQAALFHTASAREHELFQALLGGAVDAGLELANLLEDEAGRTQDLVNVYRRVVLLKPGDAEVVGRLYAAALADRNSVYGRAVEHVLAVLDPSHGPVAPPPLADQVEQPDAVRVMLFREGFGPVQEALALVWDGAEHVFRRDPSTYGVTGLERVSPTAPTPLGRAYASASRALGLIRTPLFQRRSAGDITVNLALLSPPAVILSGDVRRDTPELGFHLGSMLAATIPQHALLFGSPESQARAVLRGLGFAFGPPRPGRGNPGGVLNLAEVLWESIPGRYQRRLRELCEEPDALDYDVALAAARIAVRRAGLFVAGDLAVALREICAGDDIPEERLRAPGGIAELCRDNTSIRALIALALSPEYAQTRWQFARPAPRY